MLLSSNVIKNVSVGGEKKIITAGYKTPAVSADTPSEQINKDISEGQENDNLKAQAEDKPLEQAKIDPEEVLRSYEKIGKKIIEDAEKEKDDMMQKAQEEIEKAKAEAVKIAEETAKQRGYDEGYSKAYEEILPKAQAEAEEKIKQADNLLLSAQNEYESYVKAKKNEILKLIISIAENVTKKTLQNPDSLNEMVEEGLKISKGEESVIIKANSIHTEELRKNCDSWKINYNIKNDIFVVDDDSVEPGNAVIEKQSGVVKAGMDIGFEAVKQALGLA